MEKERKSKRKPARRPEDVSHYDEVKRQKSGKEHGFENVSFLFSFLAQG